MVKRICILLTFLLLVVPLSFGAEDHLLDEGGYFTEEERQEVQEVFDALMKDHQIQGVAAFLETDRVLQLNEFLDLFLSKYPGNEERIIVFAYSSYDENFFAFSKGTPGLGSEQHQIILNELSQADLGSRGVSYLKAYFERARSYLETEPKEADALPLPGIDPAPEEEIATTEEVLETEQENQAKVFLQDHANLWTEEERAKLLEKAENISIKEDVAILLATTDSNPNKSSEAYIEDLAEEKFGIDTNQLAFLIDMDHRKVEINTSGKVIDILHNNRIEAMLDNIFEYGMSKQNYYKAADVLLDDAANYLEQGVASDYTGREERKEPNNISPLDGLAGLGLAGTGGLGFFSRTKRRYAKKAAPLHFSYRSNIIGGINPAEGRLINSRVTTRIIPKASSGGGSKGGGTGSTTHRSSSGGTRGGGGRSF